MLRAYRRTKKYQFYIRWFHPTGAPTHDLPPLKTSTLTITPPMRWFWLMLPRKYTLSQYESSPPLTACNILIIVIDSSFAKQVEEQGIYV